MYGVHVTFDRLNQSQLNVIITLPCPPVRMSSHTRVVVGIAPDRAQCVHLVSWPRRQGALNHEGAGAECRDLCIDMPVY